MYHKQAICDTYLKGELHNEVTIKFNSKQIRLFVLQYSHFLKKMHLKILKI